MAVTNYSCEEMSAKKLIEKNAAGKHQKKRQERSANIKWLQMTWQELLQKWLREITAAERLQKIAANKLLQKWLQKVLRKWLQKIAANKLLQKWLHKNYTAENCCEPIIATEMAAESTAEMAAENCCEQIAAEMAA